MADDNKAGGGPEDPEGQPDKSNVEQRLGKLEKLLVETTKQLENERKDSIGKDKKITELVNEKKELQKATLSKDQLLEVRQKELDEAKAEWEQQRAAEKIELERLKTEALKQQVLDKLDNFPSFLRDRIRGNTAEEIEADARGLLGKWIKERDKVNNAKKIGPRPQSGNGKQISVTAEEVSRMTPDAKKQWAATASDEELEAVLGEL
jgi:hypothetical protein